MLFDKLFNRKRPGEVPNRKKPEEVFNENMVDRAALAEALAEYAVQNIKVGPIQTEAVIPPFQGDFAKAIFLWSNGKKSSIKDDDGYARYILYECGIVKPSSYHRQMIEEGYLEQDSFEKALESLKLNELKEIAEEKGLGTSGKKADLAKRIVQAGDIDYLRRQFPATFSLSEKGKQFVEEHDECVQIHRHQNWLISWDEYSKTKRTCADKTFYGVCNDILLSRAAANKRNFGMIEYLNLSKLEDEFGDPRRALRYLLQMAYISVSGVMGMDSYSYYKEGVYSKQSLKNQFITSVPPIGVADLILKHKDAYDESIIDKLFTWKLPVMICDKPLFTEIVNSILEGTYNHQFFCAQLKVRYDRFVDSL